MQRKRAFLVGRRTRAGVVVVVVEWAGSPIAGPWTLEAVVKREEPEPRAA